MAHPKLAGVEVRNINDEIFVFDCQNPECKVPAKPWPYQVLAVELRRAWDDGQRTFVVT
jgi:hypothetical protein